MVMLLFPLPIQPKQNKSSDGNLKKLFWKPFKTLGTSLRSSFSFFSPAMLSLYLHIPFCQSKCKYCAFSSFPLGEKADLVPAYLSALKAEIQHYGQLFPNAPIKTLYFGGGTPNLLGLKQLCELINEVEQHFDCHELAELSFEFNPYPEEEIFALVRGLQAKYGKKYPRIRFSFGIQSFDNEVLQLAGRKSSFLGLVDFLRNLQALKQDSTVFNFDFIAF